MNLYTERIEKYISGELNSDEKIKFEQDLLINGNLKEDYEMQKLILVGIERDGLKNEIKMGFRNARRRIHLIRWSSAAGILIVGVALFFISGQSSTKKSELEKIAELPSPQIIAPIAAKTETLNNSDSVETPFPSFFEKKKAPEKKIAANNVKTKLLADSVNKAQIIPETFKIPAAFLVAPNVFRINPLRDTILVLTKKETKIHIPAHSFVSAKGEPVKETVDLTYKEYTNAAEMAFSGIPMTYKKDNVEYNFNSSGMFEIEGTCKSEKIKMDPAKNVTIDYALAKQNPDIDFYYLNKETGAWEFKQEIKESRQAFLTETVYLNKTWDGGLDNCPNLLEDERNNCRNILKAKKLWPENDKDVNAFAKKNGDNWQNVFIGEKSKIVLEDLKRFASFKKDSLDFSKMNPQTRDFFINTLKEKGAWPLTDREIAKTRRSKSDAWENKLLRANRKYLLATIIKGREKLTNFEATANQWNSDKIISTANNTGHTFPGMIQGLRLKGFGIYNCDAVSLMEKNVHITPTFLAADGNEIKNLWVMSVVDLKLNAAFSFDPRTSFNCSSIAQNVLILFTTDKKIFTLDAKAFEAMNIKKDDAYSFTMKDASDEIKDTEKLQEFIERK